MFVNRCKIFFLLLILFLSKISAQTIYGRIDDFDIGIYQTETKTISGVCYGVCADSCSAPIKLANADVWIGRKDFYYAGNIHTTTGEDGSFFLTAPRINFDTLFIQAKGYHLRNILPDDYAERIAPQYLITEKIDIDFFNSSFLYNSETTPMAKIDDKWKNILPFYLVNPPTKDCIAFVKCAAEEELPKFTGGIYKGILTGDSTKAYGKIRWKKIPVNGYVQIKRKENDWSSIESVDITINLNRDSSDNPCIKETICKEILNSVNGNRDIQTVNVPQLWKKSLWYQGSDQTLRGALPQWDIDMGTVAAKLPRGYKINIIH